METEGTPLLRFIPATVEPLQVLTVEQNNYLPALRQLLPRAAIHAVTEDEMQPDREEFAGLDIQWNILNYQETAMAYEKESFDYIIAGHCLEENTNPQDIAAGFGSFIKQTGFLLTSFRNIRYWQVIRDLMAGHFYHFCTHMYTKKEMERLLIASFYKEAVFVPLLGEEQEPFVGRLEEFGFENRRQDLATKEWLVKAARSTSEIAALKSLYTPAVRRQLVTQLRRIECGIDTEENLAALWQLIAEQGIFPDYLAEFIEETIPHKQAFYRAMLASPAAAARREFIRPLLSAAVESTMDENKQEVLRAIEEAWENEQSQ